LENSLRPQVNSSEIQSLSEAEKTLVTRYVQAFQKALALEIFATRENSFELSLHEIQRVSPSPYPELQEHFQGRISSLGTVMTREQLRRQQLVLRYGQARLPIQVLDLHANSLLFSLKDPGFRALPSEADIINEKNALSEQLQFALEGLRKTFSPSLLHSLALFSNSPTPLASQPFEMSENELNKEQELALHTSLRNSVSFIWGPPGTGKTHTLSALVCALLMRKERVLVVATTNAAIDNVLLALQYKTVHKQLLLQGKVLRFGSASTRVPEANLQHQVRYQSQAFVHRLEKLLRLRKAWKGNRKALRPLIKELRVSHSTTQQLLFGGGALESVTVPQSALRYCTLKKASPSPRLLGFLERRSERLDRLLENSRIAVKELREILQDRERHLTNEAQLIVSTLTSLHTNPLLHDQKFDTLVLDEAGMASPAHTFLAATFVNRRIVCAGDPRQLPAVVQSDAPFAQKVLGRDIFEIALGEALQSENCILLKTQYRMLPAIANVASKLFYCSALETAEQEDKPPLFRPLTLIDTSDFGEVKRPTRGYSRLNEASAMLGLNVVKELLSKGITSASIITPYAAQARHYQGHIEEDPVLHGIVESATVHRFQGREAEAIILDLVDTPALPVGKLLRCTSPSDHAARLLNVSITRAKKALVIIADRKLFAQAPQARFINTLLNEVALSGHTIQAHSLTVK